MNNYFLEPSNGQIKIKTIFICLICCFILAIVGINVFLHISIPDFYKICDIECNIPGLNDGFIPQGLSYIPEDDIYLTCGYMKNGSASRIYIFNNEESDYVLLNDNNMKEDKTHAGGIAYWNNYVFMAHNDVIAVYNWKDIKVSAKEHKKVSPIANLKLDFESAFCYIDNDTLYIGEFYREGDYETPKSHHLVTDNGDIYHSIICAYNLKQIVETNFSEAIPLYAYSIPDLTQGMCISDNGEIYISTSWGLAFSHIYKYEKIDTDKIDSEFEIENKKISIYYLDSDHVVEDKKIIPMCEELYYKNGKVYFINESASNKYRFGKFIHGDKVYSFKSN